ncbi:hypothetical protein MMPV_005040 [Pyropia vietnamensis]
MGGTASREAPPPSGATGVREKPPPPPAPPPPPLTLIDASGGLLGDAPMAAWFAAALRADGGASGAAPLPLPPTSSATTADGDGEWRSGSRRRTWTEDLSNGLKAGTTAAELAADALQQRSINRTPPAEEDRMGLLAEEEYMDDWAVAMDDGADANDDFLERTDEYDTGYVVDAAYGDDVDGGCYDDAGFGGALETGYDGGGHYEEYPVTDHGGVGGVLDAPPSPAVATPPPSSRVARGLLDDFVAAESGDQDSGYQASGRRESAAAAASTPMRDLFGGGSPGTFASTTADVPGVDEEEDDDADVVAISMIGPARTGKSFVANALFGTSFPVHGRLPPGRGRSVKAPVLSVGVVPADWSSAAPAPEPVVLPPSGWRIRGRRPAAAAIEADAQTPRPRRLMVLDVGGGETPLGAAASAATLPVTDAFLFHLWADDVGTRHSACGYDTLRYIFGKVGALLGDPDGGGRGGGGGGGVGTLTAATSVEGDVSTVTGGQVPSPTAGASDSAALRPTALVFVLHDADGGAVAGSSSGAAADAARLGELEATLRADVTRLWADTPRPAALVGMPLGAVFLVSVVGLPHPRYRALEWRAAIADLRLRLHGADPTVGRGDEAADASHCPPSSAATNTGAPSLLPRACSKQLPSHAAAMMVGMAWRAVLEADGAATAGAAQGGAAAAAAAALASVSTWVASAGAGVSPAPPPGGAGGGGWPRPPAAGPVGVDGGGGPVAAPPSRRQLLALYTADVAASRVASAALAAIDKAARPLSRPSSPLPTFGNAAAATIVYALADFDRRTAMLGPAARMVVAAKRAALTARLEAVVRPLYHTALRRARVASMDSLTKALSSGDLDPGTPGGDEAAVQAGVIALNDFRKVIRDLEELEDLVPGLSPTAALTSLEAAIADALRRHPGSSGVALRAAAALERDARRASRRVRAPDRPPRGGRLGLHVVSSLTVAGGGSWTAAVDGAPSLGPLGVGLTAAAANDGDRAAAGAVARLSRAAEVAARRLPPRTGGVLTAAAERVTAARVQPMVRVDADL